MTWEEISALRSKIGSEYFSKHPDKLIKFIKSGRFNTKKGYFTSSKCDKQIYYMSSLELKFLELCEANDNIVSISTCEIIKYTYNNIIRNYIPDFKIILKSGEVIITEIKPEVFTNDPKVVAKKLAAEEYCKSNNMRYEIITDRMINNKLLPF